MSDLPRTFPEMWEARIKQLTSQTLRANGGLSPVAGGRKTLDTLNDISISNLTDNDALQYNSSTGVWENGQSLRIDGNIGFDTDTPDGRLNIIDEGTSVSDFFHDLYSNEAGARIRWTGRRADGTQAIPTGVSNGDILLDIISKGFETVSDAFVTATVIRTNVDGEPSDSIIPGRIGFFTVNDGAGTERVRIDRLGNTDIIAHDGSSRGLKLAGSLVTSTAAELNYNDITTLGTAEASKTITADANIDVTAIRNLTITGTGTFPVVDINGGSFDGGTIGTNSAVTELQVDAVNINGTTIMGTGPILTIDVGSMNELVLGSTADSVSSFTIQNDNTVSAANMRIAGVGSGVIQRSTSSARYKTAITDIPQVINPTFRPRQFKSKCKNDDPNKIYYGLIAEEVYTVFPGAVYLDEQGRPDAIDWNMIVTVLCKQIMGLEERIEVLEKA